MNYLTKPISQLLKPTSKTLYISLYTTSSLSHHNSQSTSFRRHDEEGRSVRVSVWWDIENCHVPTGVNGFKIAHSITSAVRLNGIKGPVQITAFGDVACLSKANQEALSCTGVNLIHIPNVHNLMIDGGYQAVIFMHGIKCTPGFWWRFWKCLYEIPGTKNCSQFDNIEQHCFLCPNLASLMPHDHGGKNSADRSLLVDLMYWVSQNPPPAHIFLISGDRDFSGILHKLRMSNYNILLAAKEANQTPGVLCSAASIMWYWSDLTKGENLSGKHFNQPPDGPFNSWYGHYRGTIEDPFAFYEQQKCSDQEDSSNSDQSSSCKHRPGPTDVSRQLRCVINSFPKGVSITELRDSLKKSKVVIDKDLYGYMKFSSFLMAFPRIVEVRSRPDGQFFLLPASKTNSKTVDTNEVSAQGMIVNCNMDARLTDKANGKGPAIPRMVNIDEKKWDENDVGGEDLNGEEASNEEIVESSVNPSENYNSECENGLFRHSIDAEKLGDDDSGRMSTYTSIPDKSISEEKQSKSYSQRSSSDNALTLVAIADTIGKSKPTPGFIAKTINWFRFWRNESDNDKPIGLLNKEPVKEDMRKSDDGPKKLDDNASHRIKHKLLDDESFWNVIRSFLKTRQGTNIVLNSLSREQIAERLQKEGPLVLQPLQATDIRHLVELLFTEKKWINEFPTKNPRFQLISISEESTPSTEPQNPTELNSIFLSSSSHDNASEKSKTEILEDCRKLLEEVLAQYPDGYHISAFKQQFVDKYGYCLDHKKLGFPKLVTLLRVIPGVEVESIRVFRSLGPKEKLTGSDREMSDSARKDNDVEPASEKLACGSQMDLSKEEAKSSLNGASVRRQCIVRPGQRGGEKVRGKRRNAARC